MFRRENLIRGRNISEIYPSRHNAGEAFAIFRLMREHHLLDGGIKKASQGQKKRVARAKKRVALGMMGRVRLMRWFCRTGTVHFRRFSSVSPMAVALVALLIAGAGAYFPTGASTVEAAAPSVPSAQPERLTSSTARLLAEQSAITSPKASPTSPIVAERVYTLNAVALPSQPGFYPIKGWCEVIDSMGSSRATTIETLTSQGVRLIGTTVTCHLKGMAGIPLRATLLRGKTIVDTMHDDGASSRDLVLTGR